MVKNEIDVFESKTTEHTTADKERKERLKDGADRMEAILKGLIQ